VEIKQQLKEDIRMDIRETEYKSMEVHDDQ
jgi:hypothetical protein